MDRKTWIDMKIAKKPALSIIVAAVAAVAAAWTLGPADSRPPAAGVEKDSASQALPSRPPDEPNNGGEPPPTLASGSPEMPPSPQASAKAAGMAGHPAVQKHLLLTRRLGQRSEHAQEPVIGQTPAPTDAEKRVPEIPPVTARAAVPTGERASDKPRLGDTEDGQVWWASPNWGLGAGVDRFPRWLGAGQSKSVAIPYINVNWQDRVQFSTVDGLVIDAIHGERWHGGLVGTMLWGRSTSDLGTLANRVPTRSNTLQAGGYLEYAVTKELSIGIRARHDIQSTGAAYGDIYLDMDLPAPGPVDHSIRVAAEAMNRGAMRRFFGVSQDTAGRLGVAAYQPGGGMSQYSATYQAFIPTSEHTGFALAASLGKLAHAAADSPLVRSFGSPYQRNFMAAFVVHY